MENTERQKLEEEWKSAFDGAETTPPDSVWNSIELDLAGQESATMKEKVVFYQRLAAAMLVFALSAGVYAYYSSMGAERARGSEQRATNETQSATSNEQRATSNEQRATSNEQRATSNEHRATDQKNSVSEKPSVKTEKPVIKNKNGKSNPSI